MGTPRVFGAPALTGRCRVTGGFGDGLFVGRVLLVGANFGVFERFLVRLVADAVFGRAFLALAVVREAGFRRVGFFVRTLAGFFLDVAIGRRSHPDASASARPHGLDESAV